MEKEIMVYGKVSCFCNFDQLLRSFNKVLRNFDDDLLITIFEDKWWYFEKDKKYGENKLNIITKVRILSLV